MYIASHISQVLLFGAANRLGGLKLYPPDHPNRRIAALVFHWLAGRAAKPF